MTRWGASLVLGFNALATTVGYILYQCFLTTIDTSSLVLAAFLPNLLFLLHRQIRAGVSLRYTRRLYAFVLLYTAATLFYWYAFWIFLRSTSAQVAIVITTLSILVSPAGLALLGFAVGDTVARQEGLSFRLGRLSGSNSFLALLALSMMLVAGVILMRLDLSTASSGAWLDIGTAGLLACVLTMAVQEIIKSYYAIQVRDGRIQDRYNSRPAGKSAPTKAHIVMMAQILAAIVSTIVLLFFTLVQPPKPGTQAMWTLDRLWLVLPLFAMGFVGNAYTQIIVSHFQDPKHGNLSPLATAPWLALRPIILTAGTAAMACWAPSLCATAQCGSLPSKTFWLGAIIAIAFFVILMVPFYKDKNGFSGSA